MTTQTSDPRVEKILQHLKRNTPGLTTLESANLNVQKLSSQCPIIDSITDGGFPRGRITEISGPESSGKTTLLLHAIAQAQKNGEVTALIDAEHKINPDYAAAIGVDLSQLIFLQPKTGEIGLELVEELAKQQVSLVAIDSIAALIPQAALERSLEDSTQGLHSNLLHKGLNRITQYLGSPSQTTILATNQLRYVQNLLYGNPERQTGGFAMRYHSSLRINLRSIQVLKSGSREYGIRVKASITKSLTNDPFQSGEFDLHFGQGIDQISCMLEMAETSGILERVTRNRTNASLQLCESYNSSRPENFPKSATPKEFHNYFTAHPTSMGWLKHQIQKAA